MSEQKRDAYWRSNIRILSYLLSVWFLASFGAGILFVDFLDNFRIGGFKLGFWVAQQGAILVFVALVFVYIRLMDKLDDDFANEHSKDQDNAEGSQK